MMAYYTIMTESKEIDHLDVTGNLAEIIGHTLLKQKLKNRERINAYWGTAPTGEPHLGYLVPLIKIRDMVRAGWDVTVLLADVHSFMDEGAESCTRVEPRTTYYEFVIQNLLYLVGVNGDEYRFVKGSSYQFDRRYCLDLLKFTAMIGVRDAQKAGSEVVKSSKNPRLSTLIYPLMQVLDETILEADVQLGGLDQRKIFMLSWDWVEKLGHKKCTYFMNPIIPSLTYGKRYMAEEKQMLNKSKDGVVDQNQLKNRLKKSMKMSASDPNGKISFTDTDDEVGRKINKAFCLDGDCRLELNAVLCIVKYIILPLAKEFTVTREEKYGGDKTYCDFVQILEDWEAGSLVGADLKPSVTREVTKYIRFMREKIEKQPRLRENAYSTNI
jgi:tyrosyl-tRNA synthetase